MGDLFLISKDGDRLPVPAEQYSGIFISGEKFTFEALEEVVRYYLEADHPDEECTTIDAKDRKVKITIEVL